MHVKFEYSEIQSLIKAKTGREIVLSAIDEQTVKPKSVIRISLCRTAKRNPLIFPI